MQARPEGFGAPAVDRRAGDNRGGSRAGLRAPGRSPYPSPSRIIPWLRAPWKGIFLAETEKEASFVADEVVAQALFAGHRTTYRERPPLPVRDGKQYQSLLAARKKVPARVALSLFLQTGVQGSRLRPEVQSIASLTIVVAT